MDNTFGESVKALLKSKGWRQTDLARESGLTTVYISKLLNGHMLPSAEMCSRIALSMKLSAADFQMLHRLAARAHGFAV